jgi:hypothetical protein
MRVAMWFVVRRFGLQLVGFFFEGFGFFAQEGALAFVLFVFVD